MGTFTIEHNTEVDIYVDDVIDNLSYFNNDELSELKEEIESILKPNKSNVQLIEASNLEEEYKIEILNEFFNKFSWEELESIKKKIIK